MMCYPVQRVWGLQRQLATEKKRRETAEKHLKEARERLVHCNGVHGEVIAVHNQIEKMAGQIADQLVPQNELVVNLKHHIAQLHQRLGASPAQAWYHTLVEAGDYANMGPTVSALLANANKEDVAQEFQVQENDITGPSIGSNDNEDKAKNQSIANNKENVSNEMRSV